ncbi:hypothetical protein [Desulfosporosinus sp. SB140]|uniref:hypothetical protein n=1 Tax=Desulfosporosinus paludis TaxID=3115649 RepID=UPI00388D0368
MKRIAGIALMTITLLLGTASIASATPAPNYRIPQTRTFHNNKSTHHQNQASSKATKLTVHKSTKTVKPTTTKLRTKKSTAYKIHT